MSRVKTYDSTGLATAGRLYAGDLNAIQDQYADLFNLLQAFGVATIAIGESGLQLVRYGAGEARLSGHFRTDGIIRALGGFYAGAFTTTARDAIAAGSRPFGLIILNTTTSRLEINMGSDATPSWQGLSASITSGTLASRPGAAASNANNWYFATDDNGGTIYFSTGSTWTKAAKGITEAPVAHAAAHLAGGSDAITWTTPHGSGTLAARPAAGSTNSGYLYFATDDTGGTLYRSSGSAWTKIGVSISDPALTNSRTPTAHAATHAFGGSDVLDFKTIVGLTGTLAARPSFSGRDGQYYFATDVNGGTIYRSDGAAWTQAAHSVSIATGEITSTMILDGTIVNGDIANNTIDAGAKLVPGSAQMGTVVSAFPTTGLFTGYRVTLYQAQGSGGYVTGDYVYRPDLDGTYPWHYCGGGAITAGISGSAPSDGGYNYYALSGNTPGLARSGIYHVFGWSQGGAANGGGGVNTRLVSSNGNVASGNSWGNNSHQAWNALYWSIPAGGYVYQQGGSSINGASYGGNVGVEPIRLA